MDATFTFAHLSDPHLTSPAGLPARALLGKRALGYLAWRLRRRARHRVHVLTALRRDLQSTRPDHVVITGDLTTLGLPGELDEARRWLEALGPPARLTVVPGNHDTYVRAGVDAMLARWQPYLVSDGGAPHPPRRQRRRATAAARERPSVFPSVRVRGPVAFIGVSSARPSAPLLAVGSVGAAQLQRLGRALAEARARGLFRVVLVHHPVLAGTVPWRKRLTDAGALRDVLAREGAELVLHGHGHRLAFGHLDAAPRPIPVVGVPSASATSTDPERAARYHLYRLTRRADGWEVTLGTRGYSVARDSFAAAAEPRRLR
jgi:3',5'-cyclic AMP phosphodiesterase CpdA